MAAPDNEDQSTPAAGTSPLLVGLIVAAVILFLADFFYKKKGYVSVELIPGFYAIFGLVVAGALVIAGGAVLALLKRDESYYAPHDVESERYPDAGLGKREATDAD